MKIKTIALLLAFSGLLVAGGARAETGAELLKSKGCVNCHDAEKKKVGPSMKDIAAKKGKPAELAIRVSTAKGHPKVKASEEEVKAAVDAMLLAK
jgi:cytochrome c551/c552